MYADKQSRGGILEPPGICEVKYRSQEQKIAMHRLDPTLIELDDLLVQHNRLWYHSSFLPPDIEVSLLTPCTPVSSFTQNTDAGGIYTRPTGVNSESIAADIKNREKNLAPLYTQIAYEFADLHDR
jgi:hypothetical protein